MRVLEIADGLWRWTGYHEQWRQEVGCVYAEAPDAICLIDPLVPPDQPERFWAALDRDVERLGRPVHVFVTVYWHTRHASRFAERYGARVWATSRARAPVARRAGEATAFRPGDRLPGGVEAFASGRGTEVVYWLPAYRALVPGDVLLGADGGLRLCPESWLPSGVDHARLRTALAPLRELPVERVLVSHGEPVLRDGAEALRRALAR